MLRRYLRLLLEFFDLLVINMVFLMGFVDVKEAFEMNHNTLREEDRRVKHEVEILGV